MLDEVDIMGTAVLSDAMLIAREEYTKKLELQKAKMNEYIRSISSSSNRIALAFLFDATSSMTSYMKQCRDVMKKLTKLLKGNFPNLELRILIVLYRDPLESDEASSHVSFATSSEREFREFMDNSRAHGGGDEAEDIAGGLELLNEQISAEDTSQTLLVIHIFDSPAHGYSIESSDNHNTEEQRSRLQTNVGEMTRLGMQFDEFEYHFFGVSNNSDLQPFQQNMRDMIARNVDDEHSIENIFKQMDIEQDFSAALMQSTFNSISGSVKHRFSDPFAVLSTKTTAIEDFAKFGLQFASEMSSSHQSKIYPTDDNIAILDCIIMKARIPDTGRVFLRNLIEYCKAAPTFDMYHASRMNWWSQFNQNQTHSAKRAKLTTETCFVQNPLMFLSTKAFGKGKEHIVFHGKLASLPNAKEVKNIKATCRSEWKSPNVNFESVMLKFNLASESAVQPKLEIYAAIKFLLNNFNALNRNKNLGYIDVEIIAPFIVELSARRTSIMSKGKSVFVSPKSDKTFEYAILGEHSLAEYPSQYNKWINNNGVYSAHMTPALTDEYEHYCVLHAFILYCWRVTNGNFVPSDLQGKLVTRQDFAKIGEDKNTIILLTDMACSAKNKEAFDADVNLGELFVSKIARDAFEIFTKAMPEKFKELVAALPGIKVEDFDNI